MADKKKEIQRNVSQEDAVQSQQVQELPVLRPATDIYDSGRELVIVADMPGVAQEGLDIQVEDNVLSIAGTRKETRPENLEMIYRGYREGVYRRSFSLPADIDRDKISAVMKNGVLTVTLPKSEKTLPKKIKVICG